MKLPNGMASVVVKLFCVLCAFSIQGIFVQGEDGLLEAWQKRVSTTVALLQNNPCRALSRGSQCDPSTFVNLDTQTVRLYTAQGQTKSKLKVVLTEGKRRRLTKHSHRNDAYDAVFVLDPYPDANFGHIVFIFLVNFDVNQTVCNRRLNGIHVFTGKSFLQPLNSYTVILITSLRDIARDTSFSKEFCASEKSVIFCIRIKPILRALIARFKFRALR